MEFTYDGQTYTIEPDSNGEGTERGFVIWNNDPNVHGAICRCFLPGNRDIRESIDMLLNEKVFNGKIRGYRKRY